jgi:hypothetical protein
MRRLRWIAALALVVGACAKSAGRDSKSPAPDGEASTLEEYERLLADQEARLRAHGVDLAQDRRAGAATGGAPAVTTETAHEEQDVDASEPAPAAPAVAKNRDEARTRRNAQADRCEIICDLAAATCELESRICALADEHRDEPRYAAACDRAGHDCELAQEACRACAP